MITVMIPMTLKKPVQKARSKMKKKKNLQPNQVHLLKVANLQERKKQHHKEKVVDNYLKTFNLLIFFGST